MFLSDKFMRNFLASSTVFASLLASAAEKVEGEKQEEKIVVTGEIIPENGHVLTGSSKRIEKENITKHSYADANQILRQTPGVYLREEDGYGLFPNISLRGVSSHRSTKVTLMEDGIPAAPAVYAAPDAYYAPNAGRMESIEVIKGSSSVKFGPHTVGGVVNYVSTPIPEQETFYWKQLFGSDSEIRTQLSYGNVHEFEAGKLSWIFEGYYRENDGFKDIQNSSKETGIENQFEPTLKLRWEPDTSKYQYLEFKAGYTDMDANMSYTGLERDDFNHNPYDRYWGTQFDHMDTEAFRTYLKHFIELDNNTTWANTLYFTRFTRNWKKLKSTSDDIIQGTGTGNLTLKNNNRDYYNLGYQSELITEIDNHTLTLGARFHKDRYDDYSWRERYVVSAPRTIAGYSSDLKGSDGNKKKDAFATAIYLHDEIALTDKLTITPGVRYEHIRYQFNDQGKVGTASNKPTEYSHVDLWIPGVGLAYQINDELQVFSGIHKGIAAPEPEGHSKGETKHETSYSFELGLRHQAQSGDFGSELVFFHNTIKDIYEGDSLATGASKSSNIDDAETFGLELSGYADLGQINSWSFANPWQIALTWTETELSDLEGVISGGQYDGAVNGNEIPYIPAFQFSIGTGLHWEKFGVDASLAYVDEAYTNGSNTANIDNHVIVDLSTYYKATENLTFLANISNVFGEEYEAAQHPSDIRPGAPRLYTLGFEYGF